MKRIITICALALITIVVASKTGALESIALLLLIGAVPGTQLIIPANVMSLVMSALICFTVFYPFVQKTLRYILTMHAKQTPAKPRHISPATRRRLSRA